MIGALTLGASAVGGLGLWSACVEPMLVRVRRHVVPMAGLDAELTAVVIGDLQPFRLHWPGWRLARLFARLQAAECPDLVFWLGDYFNAPTKSAKRYLEVRPKWRRRSGG